jgi:hypothetical protein
LVAIANGAHSAIGNLSDSIQTALAVLAVGGMSLDARKELRHKS